MKKGRKTAIKFNHFQVEKIIAFGEKSIKSSKLNSGESFFCLITQQNIFPMKLFADLLLIFLKSLKFTFVTQKKKIFVEHISPSTWITDWLNISQFILSCDFPWKMSRNFQLCQKIVGKLLSLDNFPHTTWNSSHQIFPNFQAQNECLFYVYAAIKNLICFRYFFFPENEEKRWQ